MEHNPDIKKEINDEHQFVVQFDRRGAFKYYEIGTEEFRDYVHKATGYTGPDGYANTDICTPCENICGVNLSIGFL